MESKDDIAAYNPPPPIDPAPYRNSWTLPDGFKQAAVVAFAFWLPKLDTSQVESIF
jgi:hypothetical protein